MNERWFLDMDGTLAEWKVRLRIGGAEEFPADIGQAVDQDIKDDTCQHDYSQQRRTVDGDFQ